MTSRVPERAPYDALRHTTSRGGTFKTATVTRVTERVEAYEPLADGQLRWDPNAPEAYLVSDDAGRCALALRAHPGDPDQRCVVLRWDGVPYAAMGAPNDEALDRHHLYAVGLKGLLWLGVVRESALVAHLQPMWHSQRPTPLHYVAVSKECVIEVLAESIKVLRIDGTPAEAAPLSLAGSESCA